MIDLKLSFHKGFFFVGIIVAWLGIFSLAIPVSALPQSSQKSSLLNRQSDWPEWTLPGPFNDSKLKKDIIYPSWFTGSWLVESTDMRSPEDKPIEYQAKFKINSSGELVGDRSFNALSIGKAIIGDKLLTVKNDPSTPNRQFARFDGQEFLETKIIGRSQYLGSDSILLTDELALQIFHALDVTRVKQVETLSKYQPCKSPLAIPENLSNLAICGEQWIAIYPFPAEMLSKKPLRANHYKLILTRES